MTNVPMSMHDEGAGDAGAWAGLPPQVRPTDCGLLLEGHARSEDVAALLMQLAVDGHLTIDPVTSRGEAREPAPLTIPLCFSLVTSHISALVSGNDFLHNAVTHNVFAV